MGTCKPRPISGNLPFDAIKKYIGSYCGRIIGDAGSIFGRVIVNLSIETTSTRQTNGTVFAFEEEAVIEDGVTLQTIPPFFQRMKGGRWLGDGWSNTDADSVIDGNGNTKSPFTQVAALGDSFTFHNTYLLQAELDSPYASIRNNGIGGDTTTKLLARLQSDILDEFSSVVIVQGGVNNLTSTAVDPTLTMQSDITDIVTQIQSDGRDVVLVNIGPFSGHYLWNTTKQSWLETHNSWLSGFAASNNLPLVDIYNLLRDGEALAVVYDSGDGLHPSTDGYNAMGSEVERISSLTFFENIYQSQKLSTALLNENSGENEILQSNDLDITWSDVGAVTHIQDLVGADGVANSGWTIGGLSGFQVDYVANTITGKVPATRYEPSCILKQISSIGVISLASAAGSGSGQWDVDLSLLGDWETIDRNHPSVTIVTEFVVSGGGFIGIIITYRSGTGPLSVGFSGAQLELGTNSSSYIDTLAVAVPRDEDINTIPIKLITVTEGSIVLPFTPNVAGQVNKYLYSAYVDATHYLDVYVDATNVYAEYNNGGATSIASFAYTHLLDTQAYVVVYWDSVANEIGISAAITEAAAKAETFGTNTFIGLDSIPASAGLGSRNALSQFVGLFDDPTYYVNKAAL